jgi:uncharacterized surface protein with fasciclin (FAS1) repeats
MARPFLVQSVLGVILILLFLPAQKYVFATAQSKSTTSMLDLIESHPELSLFNESLYIFPDLVAMLQETSRLQLTVFAPLDDVITSSPEAALYTSFSWIQHLNATMRNHIVPNQAISLDSLFDGTLTSLTTIQGIIQVQSFLGLLEDSVAIVTPDLQAKNGVLHIVDHILLPAFFNSTFVNLESHDQYKASSSGNNNSNASLISVVDFVGGRPLLENYLDVGSTFVGCDQAALSSIDSYLPTTIHGAATGVLAGEFYNGTRRDVSYMVAVGVSLSPVYCFLEFLFLLVSHWQ